MRRVLIAGCGYVGRELARLFANHGWETTGLVRSMESVRRLSEEPFRAIACNLADPVETTTLLPTFKGIDLIVHCASSGHGGAESYEQVYLAGTRNLLELGPAKFIFTSSTSVYPQNRDEWISEENPAQPERETGKILRQAEELALSHVNGYVARLSGIYGPDRSIILKRFFENSAIIEGDGGRIMNQIHRDDAAGALYFLGDTVSLPGIYNVTDDTPLSQKECYAWLAAHFKRPLPPSGPIDTNRKRGVTSKRVSNAKLKGIGWQPRFTSFMQAVEEDPLLLANLPIAG